MPGGRPAETATLNHLKPSEPVITGPRIAWQLHLPAEAERFRTPIHERFRFVTACGPGEVRLQAGLEGGDVNDIGCCAVDIMNMVRGRAPVTGEVNAELRLASCAFLDGTAAAAKAAAAIWGDISLA